MTDDNTSGDVPGTGYWSLTDDWLANLAWAQAVGIELNNGLRPVPGEPGYEEMEERLRQIEHLQPNRHRGIIGHGRPRSSTDE